MAGVLPAPLIEQAASKCHSGIARLRLLCDVDSVEAGARPLNGSVDALTATDGTILAVTSS